MTRLALACAVLLASLFTVSAQADAGYKRHDERHGVHHVKPKKKAKVYKKAKKKTYATYKDRKRARGHRNFRSRYLSWRDRYGRRYDDRRWYR